MQNDVMMDGGAWADSGAPQHAKEQNVVENVKRLAEACRAAGIPVIHVHYGVEDANALVRGSWGAAPAEGLEPQEGDFVVEKIRMCGWEGTKLEVLLAGL